MTLKDIKIVQSNANIRAKLETHICHDPEAGIFHHNEEESVHILHGLESSSVPQEGQGLIPIQAQMLMDTGLLQEQEGPVSTKLCSPCAASISGNNRYQATDANANHSYTLR